MTATLNQFIANCDFLIENSFKNMIKAVQSKLVECAKDSRSEQDLLISHPNKLETPLDFNNAFTDPQKSFS